MLTICSVSFHSWRHFRVNVDLIRHLNPGRDFRWHIAQNTPPTHPEPLSELGDNVFVVEGSQYDPSAPYPASMHHGTSLNKVIKTVETRFVLVTDADFYIVRPNWLDDVPSHMMQNALAFWGVPYHPKWHTKVRYYPCAHCLFIDLQKVDRERLDFLPTSVTPRPPQNNWLRLVAHLCNIMRLPDRTGIAYSHDTGYRIYEMLASNPSLNYQCSQPVYSTDRDYLAQPRWINMLLDAIAPDSLSFRPKRPNYYSEKGFHELGLPDLRRMNWEEFLWQDRPFAFHLRGTRSRGTASPLLEADWQIAEISHALEAITGLDIAPAPLATKKNLQCYSLERTSD